MHGRLDLPELRPLYGRFRNHPLVSISASQRSTKASLSLAAVSSARSPS